MAPSLTERCVDCGCEFAVPTRGVMAYFCARCERFYSDEASAFVCAVIDRMFARIEGAFRT